MRSVSLTTLPSGSFAFRSAGRSGSRFGMLHPTLDPLEGARSSCFEHSAKRLGVRVEGRRFHEILTGGRLHIGLAESALQGVASVEARTTPRSLMSCTHG